MIGACQIHLLIPIPYSAKEAVAAMIKRLAHRNANVQLYTLEVCLRWKKVAAYELC